MRRIITAVAMAMAVLFSISAKRTTATYNFSTQDFAYPQTVEKNASAAMKSALKSGDHITTLQAAIQIAASRNLVSYQNSERNETLFDSLSNVLPAPYSSLALLLEAKCTDDQDKIRELTAKAMSDQKASSIPIADLNTLITNSDDAIAAGMSVLDFMTYRVAELLPNETEYTEAAIARHSDNSFAEMLFSRMLLSQKGGDEYKRYLCECVEKYYDTPYCAEFLRDYATDIRMTDIGAKSENEMRRVKLTKLQNYLSMQPKARNYGAVAEAIASLEAVSARIKFPSNILPDKERESEVTLTNIYDLTLLVYNLPIKYLTERSQNLTYAKLLKEGKQVASIPVHAEGTTPDILTATFTIPKLQPGLYTIVASKDGKASGIIYNDGASSAISTMLVSDLTVLCCSHQDADGDVSLYVVSAETGSPVQGASVKFSSTKYKDSSSTTALTDKSGLAKSSIKQYRYVVEKSGSYAVGYNYASGSNSTVSAQLNGDLLTDLTLYHPGDSISFAAVFYRSENHQMSAAPGEKVDVVMHDANYQAVDTLHLATDSYGRCNGRMRIPSDGLLGRYSLVLMQKSSQLGERYVNVAEYKEPTFFITADNASTSYASGDTIRVEGRGLTYTEMPVAKGKVTYQLTFRPYWRSVAKHTRYESETVADENGTFTILIPQSVLNDEPTTGRCTLLITMTDAAGESQQISIPFRIGEEPPAPPVEESEEDRILRLPTNEIVVSHGAKSANISVGSSYADSQMLVEVSNEEKVLRREFIKRSNCMADYSVEAPVDNSRTFVTFIAIHDFKKVSKTVTIIPAFQRDTLSVEAISFRDKTQPGREETWKFRFTVAGSPCDSIPVFAVMTDKSLNSITPFSWSLNPYSRLFWSRRGGINYDRVSQCSNYAAPKSVRSVYEYSTFKTPEWNLYGQSLFGETLRFGRGTFATTKMLMSAGATATGNTNDLYGEAEDMAVAMDADGAMKGEESVETDDVAGEITYRENDNHVAFFLPTLITDSDGYVEIPFTMPDFIGTWQFQIAGYNKDMKGVASALDVVVSKQVMAKLNAPRFLRTGDQVTVSATLYNNSDDRLPIKGVIRICNAATGAELSGAEYNAEIPASGQRIITTNLTVPADIETLYVTCYAKCAGATDGERVAIPVLPSSTPVTESVTFYLPPSDAEKSIELPAYADDARITLQYCANPVWECVTALPGIVIPKSKSATAQMQALYATALANGLFRKYPTLVEGIKTMSENSNDSTLISALQKNEDLKLMTLNNTPWVNSAQAETERMQSLLDYAEPGRSEEAIAELMKQIAALRNSDGGWSWCPDMQSSEFITARILTLFAELNRLGFMPKEATAWIKSGFSYCDKEIAKRWERSKRKYFSTTGLLDYLYAKSAFPSLKAESSFSPLEYAAMKSIEKNWRDFDIYHKGTAAMLLASRGKTAEAMKIMESLRQYASSDESKGVWYDNLGSQWDGAGKLLTTARVLRAFASLQPESPLIDPIRQWLLQSKQVENWGEYSALAEVTSAILDSGSDWNAETLLPEITLNGATLTPQKSAQLTGSFIISLSAQNLSNSILHISKTGAAPSWGGVISQYVAPILSVKDALTPQLAISKEIRVKLPGTEKYAVANQLKVGDRVQVILTLTTDRDMDYVAIVDDRAACLEPSEQLSEYTCSDSLYFYREVRDDATNIFIPFLPKGKHTVTYDCFVDRAGIYSLGIASAQSQQAPTITAHTSGAICVAE